jgi:hypothetical protein
MAESPVGEPYVRLLYPTELPAVAQVGRRALMQDPVYNFFGHVDSVSSLKQQ